MRALLVLVTVVAVIAAVAGVRGPAHAYARARDAITLALDTVALQTLTGGSPTGVSDSLADQMMILVGSRSTRPTNMWRSWMDSTWPGRA